MGITHDLKTPLALDEGEWRLEIVRDTHDEPAFPRLLFLEREAHPVKARVEGSYLVASPDVDLEIELPFGDASC